jgi:hypothetical protein
MASEALGDLKRPKPARFAADGGFGAGGVAAVGPGFFTSLPVSAAALASRAAHSAAMPEALSVFCSTAAGVNRPQQIH